MSRADLLLGFGGRLGFAREQAGFLFFAQPVTVALDVDGRSVVKQAVQDRGGQDRVVEDLTPIHEALVAGDDEAGAFIAPDQEPEEEARFLPGQGQVAELVEDEHAGIGQLLEDAIEPVLVPGADQPPHEALEREEQYRVSCPDRLHAEGNGQMGLAGAGWTEEDDVLGALDKAQAGQFPDLFAVDRELEVEIELVEAFDPRQPSQFEAALDATLMPPAPLGFERLGEKAL